MTEQEKITMLYNQLSPEKKAMFILVMKSITSMMEMLTVTNN